jgi:hypothetical protein
MDMPLHPSWQDICVRLVLTMIAGAIIGFNRGARGHAAGFRTTILVGLAASILRQPHPLDRPAMGVRRRAGPGEGTSQYFWGKAPSGG